MTKSLPERFSELIELLILAIEAQLVGAPIPDRVAAPMLSFARTGLHGLAARFADAFAKFQAGLILPLPAARRAAPRRRPPAVPNSPGWWQRVRAWRPDWFDRPALPAPDRRVRIRVAQPVQTPFEPPRPPSRPAADRAAAPRAGREASPVAAPAPEPPLPRRNVPPRLWASARRMIAGHHPAAIARRHPRRQVPPRKSACPAPPPPRAEFVAISKR